MGNLILPSLEIHNFRGFQHLQIERLGRVNLIVGKNNIGKSSLLEALQLYAHRGAFSSIIEMLEVREEGILYGNILAALKYLFYGRKEITPETQPITIGPLSTPEKTLTLSVSWDLTELKDGKLQTRPLQVGEVQNDGFLSPRFNIHREGHTISFPLEASLPSTMLKQNSKEINSFFVAGSGLSRRQLGDLWDKVALGEREAEDDVLNALRIVAPGVERLYFVGDAQNGRERIPVVRVSEIDGPLPLRSLGDGIQHILSIAIALVNAKDGILLIDEVENGIHYIALFEIWQLIFRIAHRLNIQVFATTHGWDCLEAFQAAAQEDQHEEALLLRLDRRKNGITATLFDERKMAIATREQIEVR